MHKRKMIMRKVHGNKMKERQEKPKETRKWRENSLFLGSSEKPTPT